MFTRITTLSPDGGRNSFCRSWSSTLDWFGSSLPSDNFARFSELPPPPPGGAPALPGLSGGASPLTLFASLLSLWFSPLLFLRSVYI
jgi:hypothetical protein